MSTSKPSLSSHSPFAHGRALASGGKQSKLTQACWAACAGERLRQWRVFPLPLDNLDQLKFSGPGESKEEPTTSGPVFFRCALNPGVLESTL